MYLIHAVHCDIQSWINLNLIHFLTNAVSLYRGDTSDCVLALVYKGQEQRQVLPAAATQVRAASYAALHKAASYSSDAIVRDVCAHAVCNSSPGYIAWLAHTSMSL